MNTTFRIRRYFGIYFALQQWLQTAPQCCVTPTLPVLLLVNHKESENNIHRQTSVPELFRVQVAFRSSYRKSVTSPAIKKSSLYIELIFSQQMSGYLILDRYFSSSSCQSRSTLTCHRPSFQQNISAI